MILLNNRIIENNNLILIIMSTTVYDAIIYGNLIAYPICFPKWIFKLIFTILCPPIGVLWGQHEKGYPSPGRIIICFILTSLFYFPGLIYALNDHKCSSMDFNTSNTNYSDSDRDEDMERAAGNM